MNDPAPVVLPARLQILQWHDSLSVIVVAEDGGEICEQIACADPDRALPVLSLPIVEHVLLCEGDDGVAVATGCYWLVAVVDQGVRQKEQVPRPERDDQFQLP